MSRAAVDLIDGRARALERAHEALHQQFKAVFAETLKRPDAYMPAAKARLREAVAGIRRMAAQDLAPLDEGGLIRIAVDEIVNQALSDVGMTLNEPSTIALDQLADEAIDAALNKVRDSLRLDGETVMEAYRKIQLDAALRSATGVKPSIAFNIAKQGAITDLAFVRRDRSGKRWGASVFTRTVLRALLVTMYCETYLLALLSNGIRAASVETGEGSTVRFDILTGYDDVQETYLHPNAERLVSHP